MHHDAPMAGAAAIRIVFIVLLAGLAVFNFYRAVRGHRDGRAVIEVRGISLDADRDDDPVGFQTAVWGNVALGIFALAVALWLALR